MLPTQQLRASLNNSSINEEDRTVELVWTTGAKGLRSFWGERYYEELSLDPSHVDLSRLEDGAPLLAVHNDRSLDAVVGVVEKAWLTKTEGRAIVRFAKDEESDRVFQKVKDKILRNVSVGYLVEEYTDVSGEDEEIPTYRATRWTPTELSIVPVGFDAKAQIRNQENQTENEVEILIRSEQNKEEKNVMDEKEKQRLEQEKLEAAKRQAEEQIANAKREAIEAERTRASEIRKMVREAKLKEELADEYINRGVSVAEARTNIDLFVKYAKEQEATQINNTTRVDVVADERDKKRGGFENALLNRVDPQNFKLEDSGRLFAGKGLLRMVEEYYGRRLGETDYALAKRAMSSSDFPLILANIAEKSIQKRYSLLPRTWSRWAKTDTLRNFKEATRLRAGDFSSLSEMNPETGEYTYGKFSEESETVSLKKHGKIHKFTEAMLINDDTGLIRKVVSEAPVAVARLENRLVYSALTTNKTMSDGKQLYSADHKNLGTAAAIGEASFDEAFQLMRNQKTVDGQDYINAPPRYIIAGPKQETAIKKFLALVSPTKNADVNVFANSVEPVIDAEISDYSYYFAADPNVIDTVVLYHLEGQESPTVETRVNWSDDSVEFKVKHFAAAAPMDHRGLVYNPGPSEEE